MKKIITALLLFLFINTFLMTVHAKEKKGLFGNLQITLRGFRGDTGTVRVALYRKSEGFPDKHEKAFMARKASIHDKQAVVIFENIVYGAYALSAHHDENNNGKMEYLWGVAPAEGYSASNNAAEGKIRSPTFEEAQISFDFRSKSFLMEMLYF